MKTLFQITPFLLICVLGLQSCTKVKEPYYSVKSVYADTTKRWVLLEDYTGHRCVNCAPAAKNANTIQDLYQGQVFVIAVHAGDFAKPDPVHYPPYLSDDFRCAAGNDWNGYSGFNIDGYPKGMVNRRPYNGKISFGTSEWNQAIQTAAGLPKLAVMTIHNTFNEQSRLLHSRIDVHFLASISGKITLTVCLLEDSIYSGQLNNVVGDSMPIIKNFKFMHILRGSLNGSFGEEMINDPKSGDFSTKLYSFDFTGKSWLTENCSVIAFISDAETKEVLHVVKSGEL